MQACRHQRWSLSLPDDWACEIDGDSASIHRVNGIGELEITASTLPWTITDDHLRFFASEQIEQGVSPAPVTLGDFSGIELIYEDDEDFWHDWLLASDDLLLQLTYTCPVGKEEKEEGMLDVILATLRRGAAA